MFLKTLPICLLLTSGLVFSQNANDDQSLKETRELLGSEKEFLNLPEEERDEFVKHYRDAVRYFQQKRIFECLNSLDEASDILESNVAVYNLYGSCYVEMRAFDKAMANFRKAQELDPDNQSVNFNVAEILFVTKQWDKAHEALKEVLALTNEENLQVYRLLEFKILLCKIMMGKTDEAVMLSEKYDYQDDSPFYYFSRAALAYKKDNELEAAEWMGRARRIFNNPAIIAPWEDTLVEFGYIEGFYGGDITAPEL